MILNEYSLMRAPKDKRIEASVRDEILVRRRREQIIEAAREVFIEKGYHKASLKDISTVSGLGPGTIYNYIRKKEDILYLVHKNLEIVFDEILSETLKDFKDPCDQLVELLRRTIDRVWENQDWVILIYQETAALDKDSLYSVLSGHSRYVAEIEDILQRAKQKGVIRVKNSILAADIVVFLTAYVALRRWNIGKRLSVQELKSSVLDFILTALGFTGKRKL